MGKNKILFISGLLFVMGTALSGCSNSSGGGSAGTGPVKAPDLTPAANVLQSFSVVQSSGEPDRGGGPKKITGQLDLSGIVEKSSTSLKPGDQKVRIQELKKVISNPGDCLVKYENKQLQPSAEKTLGSNSGFHMKISGNRCPMSADFDQTITMAQQSMRLTINHSFKVGESVKSLVGASEGHLEGLLNMTMSSDNGSGAGTGQFRGYVSSVQYGRVELQFDVKVDLGRDSSRQTEEMSLRFPDASLNLNITRSTIQSSKSEPVVVCLANGAAITKEDCAQIFEGISSSDNN